MFNRFYEPDIDINRMEIVPASVFSTANERRNVLRSIAMASAQDIKIDISASTGVHSGEDAIRYLLAGLILFRFVQYFIRKEYHI